MLDNTRTSVRTIPVSSTDLDEQVGAGILLRLGLFNTVLVHYISEKVSPMISSRTVETIIRTFGELFLPSDCGRGCGKASTEASR